MAEKKIRILLEMYAADKSAKPQVAFLEGKKDQGIPGTGSDEYSAANLAFNAFSKAAHSFCAARLHPPHTFTRMG